jgi:Tol biopolymer transport system component
MIAFDAHGPQGRHVWVIDDNGVGPARNLTVGANAQSYLPTWSPDGRRIAFVRYFPQSQQNSQIWVMNADGTNQQQLSGGPPGHHSGAHDHPAWSPPLRERFPRLVHRGGQLAEVVVRSVNAVLARFGRRPLGAEVTKIAYMRISNYYTISVINADGTNQRDVWGYYPGPSGDGKEPAWSPDGTKIAFTRQYVNSEPYIERVAVMNADGSGVTMLPPTSPLGVLDSNPAWSPDGTKIAFQSDRSGNRQVWVMNADGTGLVNLTNRSGDDNSPAWWPDGTKIAFASDRGGTFGIWTMDADGTGLSNITQGLTGHSCGNPAWSTGVTPAPPPPPGGQP